MTTENEVRERIISFARDHFLHEGFSKVTLDEIASELGMSKKTLYKYFENKEDLLRAGIEENLLRLSREMDTIVTSNEPFAEKLAGVMMMIGKQMSRLSRSAMLDMQKFTPELWKQIETFRREQIFNKIGRMIAQAREESIFRSHVNEQIITLMIINCIQGILNPEVLSQNSFSAEDAFKTIFRTIFEGALTDEARKDFHIFDQPILTL
ncbi:MAG TPA: TetR/AcrR family transcriptional regulator [Bacteroidota bacterium]|nr:TetR/AcrR family transcriptional regulator [Bacteroidota bacterium]